MIHFGAPAGSVSVKEKVKKVVEAVKGLADSEKRREAYNSLVEFMDTASIYFTNSFAAVETQLRRNVKDGVWDGKFGRVSRQGAQAKVQKVRLGEAKGLGMLTYGQYKLDGTAYDQKTPLLEILSPVLAKKGEQITYEDDDGKVQTITAKSGEMAGAEFEAYSTYHTLVNALERSQIGSNRYFKMNRKEIATIVSEYAQSHPLDLDTALEAVDEYFRLLDPDVKVEFKERLNTVATYYDLLSKVMEDSLSKEEHAEIFDTSGEAIREGNKNTAQLMEFTRRLEHGKNPFSNVSDDQLRAEIKRIEKEHPEYKEIIEKYAVFNRNLNQYKVDAGMISQETADLFYKQQPHYIPMMKPAIELPNGTGAVKGKSSMAINLGIKEAKGGTHLVENPIATYFNKVVQTSDDSILRHSQFFLRIFLTFSVRPCTIFLGHQSKQEAPIWISLSIILS